MAADLTAEQKELFKQAFAAFDKDGNGFIDANELGSVLKRLGNEKSDAEVQEMIKEADTDGNGKIDFDEFLNMIAKRAQEFSH